MEIECHSAVLWQFAGDQLRQRVTMFQIQPHCLKGKLMGNEA